jgi:hypothetical protein
MRAALETYRPNGRFPRAVGMLLGIEAMTNYSTILAAATLVACVGSAYAGPCTTGATQPSAKTSDAGSGPTPGAASNAPMPKAQQPMASGNDVSGGNPKQSGTKLMNDTLNGKAASSQDVQKQIQGQPTAAEQAAGQQPNC